MPKPMGRKDQQARTRSRLLAAAAAEFSARGFAGTSLEAIAERAGFTKGAVYSNFRNKAELFLALMDERDAEQLARYDAGLAAADHDLASRIDGLSDEWDRSITDDRGWVPLYFEFWLYATRHPDARRRLLEREILTRAALRDIIEEEAQNEAIDLALPADALALCITALFDGLAMRRYADPDSVPDGIVGDFLQHLVGSMRRTGG